MSAKGAIEIVLKDSATPEMKKIAGNVEKMTTKLTSLGGIAQNAFIMTGVYKGVTAVVDQIQLGTDEVVKFNTELHRLKGLMPQDDINKLSKDVRGIQQGREYLLSQRASAMNDLVKMGDDALTAQQRIIPLMDAATATGDNLSNMMETGSAIMKTYNIDAAYTADIMDRLITTVDRSPMAWDDLTESMKHAMPSANALGVSMDTVLAMLGQLSEAGIKGSLAGTALKNLFIRFADPTDEMAEAMKGFNFETGNFIDLLDHVSKKASIQDLFEGVGLRAVPAAAYLKNVTTETLAFRDAMTKTGGVTAERAEEQRKSLENQWKMIQSGLTGLVVNFSEAYRQLEGENLFDALNESLINWNNMLVENPESVKALTGVLDALGKTIVLVVSHFDKLVLVGGTLLGMGLAGQFLSTAAAAEKVALVLPPIVQGIQAFFLLNPIGGPLLLGLAAITASIVEIDKYSNRLDQTMSRWGKNDKATYQSTAKIAGDALKGTMFDTGTDTALEYGAEKTVRDLEGVNAAVKVYKKLQKELKQGGEDIGAFALTSKAFKDSWYSDDNQLGYDTATAFIQEVQRIEELNNKMSNLKDKFDPKNDDLITPEKPIGAGKVPSWLVPFNAQAQEMDLFLADHMKQSFQMQFIDAYSDSTSVTKETLAKAQKGMLDQFNKWSDTEWKQAVEGMAGQVSKNFAKSGFTASEGLAYLRDFTKSASLGKGKVKDAEAKLAIDKAIAETTAKATEAILATYDAEKTLSEFRSTTLTDRKEEMAWMERYVDGIYNAVYAMEGLDDATKSAFLGKVNESLWNRKDSQAEGLQGTREEMDLSSMTKGFVGTFHSPKKAKAAYKARVASIKNSGMPDDQQAGLLFEAKQAFDTYREEQQAANFAMTKQTLETSFQIGETLATMHLDRLRETHAEETRLLEEKEAGALALAGTSELKRYMIQNEFNKKKKALAAEQEAEQKKALKKQQIIQSATAGMNLASGILQIWGDGSVPSTWAKLALTAALTGLGAVQIAAINDVKFADGTPNRTVGDSVGGGSKSDSIWAKLSAGEMVMSEEKVRLAGGPYAVEQAVENARRGSGRESIVMKIENFIGTRQFAMDVADMINEVSYKYAF